MTDDAPTGRRVPRIGILGEIQGDVMVYEPMAITDISLMGAQIETAVPLRLNSLHDFRLRLGDHMVVVKGRIVHAHVCDVENQATIYRAGIEFVQPSERAIAAIHEFLDAVVESRNRP